MCDQEEKDCRELLHKDPKERLGQECMKCKEGSAVLIIRVGDAFCKPCFKEYFVHKFRATLGKNRVVYPGEKVLLAYSGGASSSAMIQQVQEGLSCNAPKKLRFVPGIVFIDEGAVCGQSWEKRHQIICEVQGVLQQTRFPFHIMPLEEVFSLPDSILQSGVSQERQNYKQAVDHFIGLQQTHRDTECSVIMEKMSQLKTVDSAVSAVSDRMYNSAEDSRPQGAHTQKLIELFDSVKTQTAKFQFLHMLRNHLILHIARANGYSKVMTGESCNRLAVNLLSNISLGRGAFLPLDIGFCDSRNGDVAVIRPMRDYFLKEIIFYNRLFNVSSVFTPGIDTKAPESSSIQRLSETFINKLQEDFPSTVSTVYRTSEKLNVSKTDVDKDTCLKELCLLCQCPLDTHADTASAFHATLVSQQLSQKVGLKTEDSGKPCCKEGTCCKGQEYGDTGHSRSLQAASIFPWLCYGCRLTVKDLKTLNHLPQYILHEADHRTHRCEMRKEIQEFLIEDDIGCV